MIVSKRGTYDSREEEELLATKKQREAGAGSTPADERRICKQRPTYTIDRNGVVFKRNGKPAVRFCELGKTRVYVNELKLPSPSAEWVPFPGWLEFEINASKTQVRRSEFLRPIGVFVGGSSANSVWQLLEEAWIPKSEWYGAAQLQEMKTRFPSLNFQDDEVMALTPEKRHGLFWLKHPGIFERFADINTKVGLLKPLDKRDFKCLRCPATYHSPMYSQARTTGYCSNAACARPRQQEMAPEVQHRAAASEQKMADELRALVDVVLNTEVTGPVYNGKEDIIVTLLSDHTRRLVQVKTLSKKNEKTPEYYQLHMESMYPDNMLIVAANEQWTRFVVALAKDIQTSATNIGVTFGQRSRTMRGHKFTTKESFLQRVRELLPRTLEEKDLPDSERYSETNILEKQSRARLRQQCEKRGLVMMDHKDNISPIDLTISGVTVQHKASSRPNSAQYSMHNDRIKDGEKKPYDVKDGIDIFCYEITTSKYEGNFIFIPSTCMREMGHLQDANTGATGHHSIIFPPPDYWNTAHSLMQFWNNYSCFTQQGTTSTHTTTLY